MSVGAFILLTCGCALLAVAFMLAVKREHKRLLWRKWPAQMGAISGIRVKVTEVCPPGMAYLVDPSVMGLSGQERMLVIHPKDYHTVARVRNL